MKRPYIHKGYCGAAAGILAARCLKKAVQIRNTHPDLYAEYKKANKSGSITEMHKIAAKLDAVVL